MIRIHASRARFLYALALTPVLGTAARSQEPYWYPLRQIINIDTNAAEQVPYNPYTGTPLAAGTGGVYYGAGGVAVRPNGQVVAGQGAVGVNPYTGNVGGAAAGYNPATGARGEVAGGYNPYTGGSAYGARGYNPTTGTAARGAAGYNPYTGNDYAARQSYNARTGQKSSFAGSYNPMTGNGSYVGESTPGRRQQFRR
jgi:hypothetical protein